MRIEIYGGSDDLVEVETWTTSEGPGKGVEFCVPSPGDDAILMGMLRISTPDGLAVRVHALYDDRGCWSFAVAQQDDEIPMPAWRIEIFPGTTYSTKLQITTDDDSVSITMVDAKGRELHG